MNVQKGLFNFFPTCTEDGVFLLAQRNANTLAIFNPWVLTGGSFIGKQILPSVSALLPAPASVPAPALVPTGD